LAGLAAPGIFRVSYLLEDGSLSDFGMMS